MRDSLVRLETAITNAEIAYDQLHREQQACDLVRYTWRCITGYWSRAFFARVFPVWCQLTGWMALVDQKNPDGGIPLEMLRRISALPGYMPHLFPGTMEIPDTPSPNRMPLDTMWMLLSVVFVAGAAIPLYVAFKNPLWLPEFSVAPFLVLLPIVPLLAWQACYHARLPFGEAGISADMLDPALPGKLLRGFVLTLVGFALPYLLFEAAVAANATTPIRIMILALCGLYIAFALDIVMALAGGRRWVEAQLWAARLAVGQSLDDLLLRPGAVRHFAFLQKQPRALGAMLVMVIMVALAFLAMQLIMWCFARPETPIAGVFTIFLEATVNMFLWLGVFIIGWMLISRAFFSIVLPLVMTPDIFRIYRHLKSHTD